MKLPKKFTFKTTDGSKEYVATAEGVSGYRVTLPGVEGSSYWPTDTMEGLFENGTWHSMTVSEPILLQRWMRVKTRNDMDWIVAEGVQDKKDLALLRAGGWMIASFDYKNDHSYDIVAVWAAPDVNMYLLNPEERGELLWEHGDSKLKKQHLAVLIDEKERLEQEIINLQREIG